MAEVLGFSCGRLRAPLTGAATAYLASHRSWLRGMAAGRISTHPAVGAAAQSLLPPVSVGIRGGTNQGTVTASPSGLCAAAATRDSSSLLPSTGRGGASHRGSSDRSPTFGGLHLTSPLPKGRPSHRLACSLPSVAASSSLRAALVPNMPLQPTVTRLPTGASRRAGARQRLNAGR